MPPLTRKLGRRPPIPDRPRLRLGTYLRAIPTPPASADHFAKVGQWILGGNDRYSDCGPVSVANDRLMVTTYLTSRPQVVSQADIFDLYRRSGNPTFDPATGEGDDGVVMQVMLEALLAGGVGGTRPVAFASVDHTSLDEMRAAVAIFGSLLVGVNLEVAQERQSGTWDYRPSGEWGGHAVMCARFSEQPDRTGVVSWATVVDMTDAFVANQLDEAWVVIWPEHLGTRAFQEALTVDALKADYLALTGRPMLPQPGLIARACAWLGRLRRLTEGRA